MNSIIIIPKSIKSALNDIELIGIKIVGAASSISKPILKGDSSIRCLIFCAACDAFSDAYDCACAATWAASAWNGTAKR